MDVNEAMSILGLTPGFTEAELKKAYKDLIKIYHPDVKGAGNEIKFKEIDEAYNFLQKNHELYINSSSKNDDSYNNKTDENDMAFKVLIIEIRSELAMLKITYENNEKIIELIKKYNYLIDNAKTKFELEQIFDSLQREKNSILNDKINNKIKELIDNIIIALKKYPEFEALKDYIYEEKKQTLREFNASNLQHKKNNEKVYITQFETKILELFAFFKCREKKTKQIKNKLTKLINTPESQNIHFEQNPFSMIQTLENSLKDKSFDQVYLETIKYIKNIERARIFQIIAPLKYFLVKIKNDKTLTLEHSNNTNSLDEITRTNKLWKRITTLLKQCINNLINPEDLEVLYNFNFSKDSEKIIKYLEEKVNTPNSASILIEFFHPYDSNIPFYHLLINQNVIKLSGINYDDYLPKMVTIDFLNEFNLIFSYFQSLDDFFIKADLIGNEVITDNNIGIAIAKCNDNYLVYNSKTGDYFFTKSIIYTENNIIDSNSKKLLTEIEDYDIDALKQRIVSYVIKNEAKAIGSKHISYRKFL